MNEPKIGIYMSCYNHENFVKEAMDSIINQTYQNWELYVVNDASTDATGEILASYKDSRIHYFDFKKNTRFIGAANFLQKILENENIDYVATMSSDDKWELDKLEKQIKVLREHSEYKACFTWDKLINAETDVAYKDNQLYSHQENRSRYDWIRGFIENGNCLNACSMLMEKEIFYELGKMNECYIQLGDWRLWMKLVSKYSFYLMTEELTYYRRHANNLSQPTAEVVVRASCELYYIIKEIMEEMDSHTFHRAFYPCLPYVKGTTKEELAAEKMYVLLREEAYQPYAQAAIAFYFSHCENETFMDLLKKNYYFDENDFIDLSGNAGLQYALIGSLLPDVKKRKIPTPSHILLNLCSEGKLSTEILPKIRYNVLTDLYHVISSTEDGRKVFCQMKEEIDGIRKEYQSKRNEKRILVIFPQNMDGDIEPFIELIQEIEGEAEYLTAQVPAKREYFDGTGAISLKKNPLNMREIDLYNREEHCLNFLEDNGETAETIWYVNCLGEDYECEEMIAGYGLHISQKCLMAAEEYEYTQQEARCNIESLSEIHTWS